jgi:hypothetical protein
VNFEVGDLSIVVFASLVQLVKLGVFVNCPCLFVSLMLVCQRYVLSALNI